MKKSIEAHTKNDLTSATIILIRQAPTLMFQHCYWYILRFAIIFFPPRIQCQRYITRACCFSVHLSQKTNRLLMRGRGCHPRCLLRLLFQKMPDRINYSVNLKTSCFTRSSFVIMIASYRISFSHSVRDMHFRMKGPFSLSESKVFMLILQFQLLE